MEIISNDVKAKRGASRDEIKEKMEEFTVNATREYVMPGTKNVEQRE